jgi:hypothetical protein
MSLSKHTGRKSTDGSNYKVKQAKFLSLLLKVEIKVGKD